MLKLVSAIAIIALTLALPQNTLQDLTMDLVAIAFGILLIMDELLYG